MTFKYEYLTLTQVGAVFGTTSHQVGRWLTEIGLRYESKGGKKPSRHAYAGGFVKDVPSRNQGYCWAWHAEKTVKAIEDAGHKVAIHPGHELLAPCRLNGAFACRPNSQFGYEVVNGDGTVAVYVTGEANAQFVTRLLNLADQRGVVGRLLGAGEERLAVPVTGGEG
ncbi:hypothetical protein J0H58_12610 [bacterium]|nr:hypothetical protein [bacterium]